ncbi:MAG: hypothetical protein H6617_01815 [Bdellovibrionaceae bacterium]|nr:hypothetical protein [Pseudobdellovibrionaceae bacterium]
MDKSARSGGGPTLIECLTLRMGPHSSSDDQRATEIPGYTLLQEKRDPILRFRQYLEGKGLWDGITRTLCAKKLKTTL